MNNSNLILTGMPGSGKSTLGVRLAKILRKSFIDTDLLIQQNEGASLQEIINTHGVPHFLKAEERAVLQLNARNSVIATGGSVIYSPDAIEHLKKNGSVLYLQLSFEEISKRIRNMATRGIAIAKDQTLGDLYNERAPLYEKYADVVVNCSGLHSEEVLVKITDVVKYEL